MNMTYLAGFQAFTIRNLDNKLSTESDIEQYKLLSVREDSIDNRQQYLDVMCFPILYPTGKFGKYHPHEVKLTVSLTSLDYSIKTLVSGKILSMCFTYCGKRNARAFHWCVQSVETVPCKPALNCRYVVEQCTS